MNNRSVERRVVVGFLNSFLVEYSGTMKNRNKMRRDLEYAIEKFKGDCYHG